MPRNSKKTRVIWICFFIYIIVFFISIGIGRYYVSIGDIFKILVSSVLPINQTWDPAMERVILYIRPSRLFVGSLVGASLGLAGATFQGLFKNPLVSPDILGVSSGAGFGAAAAILLGAGAVGIQLSALLFGLLAVAAVYLIYKAFRSPNILMLALAGIIVNGFFSSALSLTKYMADPNDTLPAITFWLMGSLAAADYDDLMFMIIPILAGSFGIIFLRWKINVLSLGDSEAKALGVNVNRLRFLLVLFATVITAVSVCVSGTIGWIGLVVPHLARACTGDNHSRLLPFSCILGALLLIILDDISRSLTGAEIPLGILTGIVGTPVFALLLIRQKRIL